MTAAGAARVRRWRRRHRAGRAVVHLEIDEAAVGELLAHHGLLPPCGCDDAAALGHALEKLVERLTAADAEQYTD
jgi:hypothetical protein